MSYHNTDIAACDNDRCESRNECLRWQLHLNGDRYQVYLACEAADTKRCERYVDNGIENGKIK